MKSKFSEDASDFLSLLSSHDVQYLVVGGWAVIYHGYSRLTDVIDVFYEISEKNVQNLYLALNEFWDNDIPGVVNENELMQQGVIIQFGIVPNRIDLINDVEEINFTEAWSNRVDDRFSHHGKEVTIHYMGFDDLIKNKKAVGRNKDLEDLKFLNKAFKK